MSIPPTGSGTRETLSPVATCSSLCAGALVWEVGGGGVRRQIRGAAPLGLAAFCKKVE